MCEEHHQSVQVGIVELPSLLVCVAGWGSACGGVDPSGARPYLGAREQRVFAGDMMRDGVYPKRVRPLILWRLSRPRRGGLAAGT